MAFRQKFCYLFVLFVLNFLTFSEGAHKNVNTSKGKVRGVLMDSKANPSSQMLVFKGIPYAQPPVGPLRFKPPETVQKWRGIKSLSQIDKPLCPQTILFGFKGLMGYDENCLYVNVYSPSDAAPSSMLPVMVWIHGGGFIAGSGQYILNGPDHLVNEGVIVVSLNYRLGALGFLSLGTEDIPGNAGLLDQSLALKWVHDEISNFGGNPNNVTIFGESAGSSSVHFHILSDMSKGLFQQAIAESGTCLSDWAMIQTEYKERAKTLADALNCTTAQGEVDIDCLQDAEVESILDHQNIKLPVEDTIHGNVLTFAPVLDMNITKSPFFKNTLENLISDPPNKVPVIMGTNKDEGISFVSSNEEFYNNLPEKMQYFIQKQTRELIDNYTINDKINKIIEFYFNGSMPTLENLQGYINLMTDQMFAVSTAITAKELSKNSEIYLYRFDFDGGFRTPNEVRTLLNLTGATHHDEIGYLFIVSEINTEGYSKDSPESKMLQTMVKLWTNFAKFGTPTVESVDLMNTRWNPISPNKTNYLIINENLTMSTDSYKEQEVRFWKDINTAINVSYTSTLTTTQSTPTTVTPTTATPTTATPTSATPTTATPTTAAPTTATPTSATPTTATPTTATPTTATPTTATPSTATPTTATPTTATPTTATPTTATPTTATPTTATPTTATPTTATPTTATPTTATPTTATPTTATPTTATPTTATPTTATPTTATPTTATPTTATPTTATPTTATPTTATPTTATPTSATPTTATPTTTTTPSSPITSAPTIPTPSFPPTIAPTPSPSSSSLLQLNIILFFCTLFLYVNV